MESYLASWQLESFSSPAEFSPPISPSPQSPTLYSNAHQGDADASIYIKSEQGSSSSSTARAQLASRILHSLELQEYHYAQYDNQNDMRWTEESINLELFEDLDLDSLVTDRPLTPDSQEFRNQEQLHVLNESPQPSPSHEIPSDSFDELSAEFQHILSGLSAQVKNIDNGEVIELLGIPCSLEEIRLLNLVHQENDAEQDDTSSSSSSSDAGSPMDIDDQSHTFDDFELRLIGLDNHHQGYASSAASPTTSVISEEDVTDHACESILDALLQGDIDTAKSFVPVNIDFVLDQQGSGSLVVSSQVIVAPVASASNSTRSPRGKQQLQSPPAERRMKKPRLPNNTNKTLRKKEQNKSAATRYREKKKIQAAIVSVQEDALEKVNNELKSQRDDLQRQVLIYKELLRAVVLDRKVKKGASSLGRHTGAKRLIK